MGIMLGPGAMLMLGAMGGLPDGVIIALDKEHLRNTRSHVIFATKESALHEAAKCQRWLCSTTMTQHRSAARLAGTLP